MSVRVFARIHYHERGIYFFKPFDCFDYSFSGFFRALLGLINLVRGFSPIDNLSAGRSVTWGDLGLAFGQIILLLGGLLSLIGMSIFTRRELASAQSHY